MSGGDNRRRFTHAATTIAATSSIPSRRSRPAARAVRPTSSLIAVPRSPSNVAVAFTTLSVAGLLERVGVLVGMDVFGVGKPDPRVYRHACAVLGVDPAQVAYVGDELDVDARGAREAGLLGVWLDRHGSGQSPPDVPVVRSLDELP